MNIQDILVYLSILAALIYTIYSIMNTVRKKNQGTCGCSSCDFKTNIEDLKKIRNLHKNIS